MAIKIDTPINKCCRCKLSTTRRCVVVGRGDLPCDILIIGDNPRTGDDLFEEAYIGEVGILLDTMLTDAGVIPKYRVYRTNTVLCRPTDGKNLTTRDPNDAEILACAGNIMKIFQDASPSGIVLLGNIAEKAWKKVFPASLVIQHPLFLNQTGGKRSPSYLKNVRLLENYICQQ